MKNKIHGLEALMSKRADLPQAPIQVDPVANMKKAFSASLADLARGNAIGKYTIDRHGKMLVLKIWTHEP